MPPSLTQKKPLPNPPLIGAGRGSSPVKPDLLPSLASDAVLLGKVLSPGDI